MILKKQIPEEFYKLFRTRNRDAYMMFLVAIYEENSELYTALGLTIEEGTSIIAETMNKSQIDWQEDEENVEEDTEEASGEEQENSYPGTPSAILRRLIRWGWLRSDYDEKLNTYILSFPEYSQLYVELFEKLQKEDETGERESILSIYSALFTYYSDQEKNNEILKSAIRTSKNLQQLLSNMQNGMRTYFEELSQSKNFMEIQQVLVDEINNSDSKRYAILTTTDSFYRYKEAVKELISRILYDNEQRKMQVGVQLSRTAIDSVAYTRLEQSLNYYDEAAGMVYRIEREFDMIERKYNKLIEQKAVFARRALARIRYIFQEGAHDEDNILKLLHLLDTSPRREELMDKLGERIKLTVPYKIFDDDSMYKRREGADPQFHPLTAEEQSDQSRSEITDFVPKPLYTRKQLHAFRDKNMKDGVFRTTKDTVNSIEDLEKIMFLWQETTENQSDMDVVDLGGEFTSESGFTFSELTIRGQGTDED